MLVGTGNNRCLCCWLVTLKIVVVRGVEKFLLVIVVEIIDVVVDSCC